MKINKNKREILLLSLIAVIVLICILGLLIYNKYIQLKNENENLQTELEQWMIDKNLAVGGVEQCMTDKENMGAELSALNETIKRLINECNCS